MYHLFLEIDDISELSVWTELRITSQILKKFLDWIMIQIIYSSDQKKSGVLTENMNSKF